MRLVDEISWIGENLYVTNSSSPDRVINIATQSWYNEITDYDYDSDPCEPGKACGHYKQVNNVVCSILFINM